jgi:hypothetical protein
VDYGGEFWTAADAFDALGLKSRKYIKTFLLGLQPI